MATASVIPTDAFAEIAATLKDVGVKAVEGVRDAFKDLGALVGAVLLPPLKVLGETLKAVIVPQLAVLARTLKDVGVTVAGSLVSGFTKLGEGLRETGAAVASAALPAVGRLGESLGPLAERLRFAADVVKFTVTNTLSRLGEALAPAAEKAKGAGAAVVAALAPVAALVLPHLKKFTAAVTETFGKLFSAVGGYAGEAFGRAQSAAGSLFRAVKGLAAGFAAVSGAAVGLGYALGVFVSKASPAVFEQFQLAANDLMAVVGQALVPVMRLVTEVVRAAGDTLVTFAGTVGGAFAAVLRPVIDTLKVVFDVVGRIGQEFAGAAAAVAPAVAGIGLVFVEMVKAVAPALHLVIDLVGGALAGVMRLLANAVVAVVPYLTAFVRVLGDAVRFVANGVRELLALVGIELPDVKGTKEGASVGAAVRSAQHGSVESVIQQAQRSAFSLGSGSADPAVKTASAAEAIRAKADAIHQFITTDLPKLIAGLPAAIGLQILSGFKGAVGATRDAAAGAVDAARELFRPAPTAGAGGLAAGALGSVAKLREEFDRAADRFESRDAVK